MKYKFSALLILFFIGCGKSDDGLSSSADLFIPNFTNAWTVQKGSQEGLFFINAADVDSSKGTGKIEGFEQVNGLSYKLSGSFETSKVKLRYLTSEEYGEDNGPHAGFSYAGKFDTLSNPSAIRLVNTQNASDSLVLRRS
jgi:hypothetical protein